MKARLIYLSIYLSIYQTHAERERERERETDRQTDRQTYFILLGIYVSIYLPSRLSKSISLSLSLSIYIYIYIYIYIKLNIFQSIYLSIYLNLNLSMEITTNEKSSLAARDTDLHQAFRNDNRGSKPRPHTCIQRAIPSGIVRYVAHCAAEVQPFAFMDAHKHEMLCTVDHILMRIRSHSNYFTRKQARPSFYFFTLQLFCVIFQDYKDGAEVMGQAK